MTTSYHSLSSASTPDGRTVALASSGRPPLVDRDGLSLDAILEYLTGCGSKTVLSWDITHQINFWAYDLPRDVRLDLCASIPTRYKGWELLFIPGKFLEMATGARGHRQRWRLDDVSGFWPSPAAIETVSRSWGLLCDPGWSAAVRAEWADHTLGQLVDRTQAMADATARLMAVVLPALEAADLLPSRLHGLGAIGSRLVRETFSSGYHWLSHYRPDRQPIIDGQPLLELMFAAYYGGRQEMTTVGTWAAPTYRYDLSSAYPWAMSWLAPIGYKWHAASAFSHRLEDRMSLWRVSWKLERGVHSSALGPLPFRERGNRIAPGRTTYPLAGQGWYWWPEVRSALASYGPSAIRVHEGYVSESRVRAMLCMVADRYGQRKRLQDAASPVEPILKGGLQSAYGRFAQRLGAEGQPGQYYNVGLAGWICSAVRARLLDAWRGHEGMVYSVMTDGLLTSMPLPNLESTPRRLGGWRVDQWAAASLILPGLYRLSRGDVEQRATTGVPPGADFDGLLTQVSWAGQARVNVRWFCPHILPDLYPDRWQDTRCRWTDQTVAINPQRIARKRDTPDDIRALDFSADFLSTAAYERLGNGDSFPYTMPPAWQPAELDLYREAYRRVAP